MITRKAPEYSSLFAVASTYLNSLNIEDDPISISSIDQYFHYIEYLAAAAQTHPEFMKLPFDEPCFDIDLDTRTITVPSEFLAGISVEGDQIAENIWFKVDRFFDQKDLLPTSNNPNFHAIVQWTNADDEEGLSETLWFNYKGNDGSTLVFCWPITNSITKKAGVVKFSVRFYETAADNAEVIKYSLSTKPCEVVILEALDSSKNVNARNSYTLDKDAETYIISQLKNTMNYGDYAAEVPVYLEPTVPGVNDDVQESAGIRVTDDTTVSFAYDKNQSVYTLDNLAQTGTVDYYVQIDEDAIQDANDFNYYKVEIAEDGKLYIYVTGVGFQEQASWSQDVAQAYFYLKKTSSVYEPLYIEAKSTDGGLITYIWQNSNANVLTNADQYFRTNDTAPLSGSVYYTKDGNIYTPWIHDDTITQFPSDKVIYERYGSINVGVADTYYGIAKNEVLGGIAEVGRAQAKKFVVAGPKSPVITDNAAARKVVITYHAEEQINKQDTTLDPALYPGRLKIIDFLNADPHTDADDIWYFDADEQVWKELTDINNWSKDTVYYRKYAALIVDATKGADADSLSYQWATVNAIDGYGDKLRHEPITGETQSTFTTNTVNEAYVVDVTATRNNGEIVKSSEIYRVTELPEKPSLKGDYYILDSAGRAVWYSEIEGNKVITEGNKGTANEDFSYHDASSYVRVKGQTTVPMYFKVKPAVTGVSDNYYYEWYRSYKDTQGVIHGDDEPLANKSGLGSAYQTCYFPIDTDANNTLTNRDILGSQIYCKVWNVVNGLGRPSTSDYDFPAHGTDSDGNPYEDIYGNEVISAYFDVV